MGPCGTLAAVLGNRFSCNWAVLPDKAGCRYSPALIREELSPMKAFWKLRVKHTSPHSFLGPVGRRHSRNRERLGKLNLLSKMALNRWTLHSPYGKALSVSAVRPRHHSCFPLPFSFPFPWSWVLAFLGCGDDPLYYIKEFPQEVTITIHTNGISLQFLNSSLLLAVLGLRLLRTGFLCVRMASFSLWWLLLLWTTGSGIVQVSLVATRGLSSCGSWALECGLN